MNRSKNSKWESDNLVNIASLCFCSITCGNRERQVDPDIDNLGSYGEYIVLQYGMNPPRDVYLLGNCRNARESHLRGLVFICICSCQQFVGVI